MTMNAKGKFETALSFTTREAAAESAFLITRNDRKQCYIEVPK